MGVAAASRDEQPAVGHVRAGRRARHPATLATLAAGARRGAAGAAQVDRPVGIPIVTGIPGHPATATADLRRTTVREQAVGRVLVQVKRAGAAASLPNAEAAVPVVRRVPRANGPVLRALRALAARGARVPMGIGLVGRGPTAIGLVGRVPTAIGLVGRARRASEAEPPAIDRAVVGAGGTPVRTRVSTVLAAGLRIGVRRGARRNR